MPPSSPCCQGRAGRQNLMRHLETHTQVSQVSASTSFAREEELEGLPGLFHGLHHGYGNGIT